VIALLFVFPITPMIFCSREERVLQQSIASRANGPRSRIGEMEKVRGETDFPNIKGQIVD